MSDEIQRKADRFGVPIIGRLPDAIRKQPGNSNPVVAICGECGREVHHIEGYCCMHNNCPLQPGAY